MMSSPKSQDGYAKLLTCADCQKLKGASMRSAVDECEHLVFLYSMCFSLPCHVPIAATDEINPCMLDSFTLINPFLFLSGSCCWTAGIFKKLLLQHPW